MINSILSGISTAIDADFTDYEIYMEEIKQGLNEPCFFIACLNPTTKLFLGKRYFRTNNFCIQYFPSTDDIQAECNGVAERLTWGLEYITVNGDKMRATKMKYKIIDGVLNFFVNYDCFVYRVESETAMETIGSTIEVKEGE